MPLTRILERRGRGRGRAARLVAILWLLGGCAAPVRAQLLEYCEVMSAPNINFGSVDPLSTSPHDVASTLTVRCQAVLSLGAVVDICLNLEAGSGGTNASTRFMTGSGGTLPFNLYKDPARTQIWGSATYFAPGQLMAQVRMTGTLGLLLKEGSTTIPLHARIPAAIGSAAAGAYASSFSGHATLRYSLFSSAACTGASHAFGFNVQATVAKTCSVNAEALDFGSRGLLDQPTDASSRIRVRCNQGTGYSVRLGSGNAPGATFASRRMLRSGDTTGIGYQLYRDATRMLVWGDGTAGTAVVGGTGNGSEQTHVVYGQVPSQPSRPPGSYRDTVVVTVVY